MAVGRSLNVKGQMRIDVPHLRLIESGVVYDFDTLAGGILAGKLPYVVTGFVPAAWVNGSAASSLSLVTADSIFVNYQASENGSMLMVPANRTPEQLTITNSRVSGSFTVSQTNYVSLDLTKTEDDSTSDVVHFIDPATSQGTPKIIPLGRTMDYQIHITTAPFSTTPQRCPVMIVVTDASNNIVSVEDARPMMYRLASGGDVPNVLAKYSWPQGRSETPNTFVGGDKAINSMKDWVSALEEMIWQINAGEYWYSNTQMTSTWFMPSGTNAWGWVLGTETISWSSPLEIVFTGSTAMHNTIVAGSAVLTADTALYVDFNRYTNGAVLTTHVGPISTLNGEPATPGIRYPIAWRVGTGTPAVRNLPVPAGVSPVGLATTTTSGSVFLNTAAATPYAVVSTGLGGDAVATGLTRGTLGGGALQIGSTNDTTIGITAITSMALLAPTVSINTTGTGATTIGNATGIVTVLGSAIDINATGTGATTIGNATGKARAGAATAGGDNILTLATKGYVDSAASGAIPAIATTTVAGSIYINTANATPYAVISNGLGGAAVATGLLRPSAGSLDIGTTTNETAITIGGGVNNQNITIGYSSATLGSTLLYGKNVTVGGSATTFAANCVNSQLGCTASATISIGVNSDAIVNINTGASSTATTSIGTASIGTVGILAATININTTGTGATVVGNATTKASATATTVIADPALTLTTKGYVDGPRGNGTTGINNYAMPSSAGAIITSGHSNVYLGVDASALSYDGCRNVAIGFEAAHNGGSHFDNVMIGWKAGYGNITGMNCVFIGSKAGQFNSVDYNIGIGIESCGGAGASGPSNPYNVAVGTGALGALTGGVGNTGIGTSAGNTITTGIGNTCLGYNAQTSGVGVTGEFVLGDASVTVLRCQQATISALSDARDKKDIVDLHLGADFIKTVRPVAFTWNRRDGALVDVKAIGFIAQELDVAQVAADAKDILKLIYESNPDKLEATPGNLFPVLVKAVQELIARVEKLEGKT
jgi:hypothetical protein